MKKNYVAPQVKVVKMDAEDLLLTSIPVGDSGEAKAPVTGY